MKSALFSLALAAPLLLSAPSQAAQTASAQPAATKPADLKPYPSAAAGQIRHVITLPALDDEQNFKVELIAGKTQEVDCNIHRYGGNFEEKTVEGWGYNYFTFSDLGPGVSTLMGCPPNSNKMAFVRSGDELLTRYNSKLPIVIYAPKDVEIRYRLWRAGEEAPAS